MSQALDPVTQQHIDNAAERLADADQPAAGDGPFQGSD